MKTITTRELHNKTGKWLRLANYHGEILVTDRGHGIARIVPHTEPNPIPYFARRKMSPAFKKLMESGKLRGGTDSTIGISEDREDRYA